LLQQVAESFAQPNVREFACRNLSINPTGDFATASAPLSRYHEAPFEVIRVLEKESQLIHPIQEIANSASPTAQAKMWVIERR
jgi:hypothetical protein